MLDQAFALNDNIKQLLKDSFETGQAVPFYRAKHFLIKLTAQVLPQAKPTLLTGPGSADELCEAVAFMGKKRVLIVTDKVLVEIGLIQRFVDVLEKNGTQAVIFDGVKPDPTFDEANAGMAMYLQRQCDAILAIGGGSSIDAAKAIAAGVVCDKPLEELVGIMKIRKACAPLFAIPTTAGTGSETSIGSVLSDPQTHSKNLIVDPSLVPKMAALDATVMAGMPPHVTAATGMDALTHAIEAFLSINATDESDGYALLATRYIMDYLPKAYKDGSDLDARHKLAKASYFGGLAFSLSGLGYVHSISHAFSAKYHVPHGLANAIVLPYVLDYNKDVSEQRLARLASAIGETVQGEAALAQAFIDRIRALNQMIGVPTKLDALKADDIDDLVDATFKEAHNIYAIPKFMSRDECVELISRMLP